MCEGEIKVERQRDRMCSRIKLHSTDTDKVGSQTLLQSLLRPLIWSTGLLENQVDVLPELGGQRSSGLKSLGQMWTVPLVLSWHFILKSQFPSAQFASYVKLCEWNTPAFSLLGCIHRCVLLFLQLLDFREGLPQLFYFFRRVLSSLS